MQKSVSVNQTEQASQEANIVQEKSVQTHQLPQGKKGSIQTKQRPVQRMQDYQLPTKPTTYTTKTTTYAMFLELNKAVCSFGLHLQQLLTFRINASNTC